MAATFDSNAPGHDPPEIVEAIARSGELKPIKLPQYLEAAGEHARK